MTQPASIPSLKPTLPAETPAEVLDFWLGDGLALGWPTHNLNERWFLGGAALDQQIKARFGPSVELAVQGGLQDWEAPLHSRLALVILLDQFTRNVFRGSARAFDGDARAQQLVLRTLALQEDRQLPWVGRVFMYMPLMHAEDAALQETCVACFSRLVADAPDALKPKLQGNLDFARQHQDIIQRFGRFPYRNAALGRSDSPGEAEFLRSGPRFGQ
ncbi:DUF924 family protein [Polaromonas naphthalenivorans]|uniref:Transmembrane protein n=1 Tax=Polaromonas naphthalenivorans (strain CJ2) TaxID=365044 RepID=A1VLZ2_POLNA|nr:DUF924 family protein [Polaromonas naphthalenivorans]ABM36670.1 protein of unknown function DUF924 [Polaromonas naphthalenivorans CJ2]